MNNTATYFPYMVLALQLWKRWQIVHIVFFHNTKKDDDK